LKVKPRLARLHKDVGAGDFDEPGVIRAVVMGGGKWLIADLVELSIGWSKGVMGLVFDLEGQGFQGSWTG
jgi:hypothetical protein